MYVAAVQAKSVWSVLLDMHDWRRRLSLPVSYSINQVVKVCPSFIRTLSQFLRPRE